MRVGDIVIESDSLPMSRLEPRSSQIDVARLAAAPSILLSLAKLVSLPVWRASAYVGLTLVLCAWVSAVILSPPWSWAVLFASAPILMFSTAAFAVARVARRARDAAEADRLTLHQERYQRVLNASRAHGLPLSFEALKQTLKWPAATLAPILAECVESGDVIEDMDPETGDWTYEASPSRLLQAPEDHVVAATAAERAAALAEQ